MIIVVDALNCHQYADVLDEMYRLRARVFQDRLGWDVSVVDGKEYDAYDGMHPAHVICLDDDGDVVGCMRLLQTTGPHMLADVFHAILDGDAPLRSSRIWEATRFCVDTNKLKGGGSGDRKARNSISYVTSEIMIGAFEYAQKAGVLDAVAVIDPVMNRVLQRSQNSPYDYLGKTVQMGKVKAMAALMDCSDERIAAIRAFNGIEGDVFAANDAEALAHFYKSKESKALEQKNFTVTETMRDEVTAMQTPTPTAADLASYFSSQITDADSPEERAAALALKFEMDAFFGKPSQRCDA